MAESSGSFFDDLLDFGAGALDSVEENLGGIIGSFIPPSTSSNPSATQQPNQGVVDNNGNSVTVPQGGMVQGMSNQTLMTIGGVIGLIVLILLVVLAMKK
ncbi:hypothetical protein [Vibrio sp. OPT18]|uniref:hypothetical protein n=1 Tax=Vibrio sp. OPT18 TaxID=2778641 RepID=UPI001882FA45|nr:hypothetical protein [Vibrio sp. OPT18]MBE8577947.1 hypothetical protein [Vibrio sp. OPT18]